MRTYDTCCLIAALTLVLAGSPTPVRGDATADRAAALLIYPYVRVDTAVGVDTIVELANTSTAPVNVRCFYENANRHCTNTQSVCQSDLDCPVPGTCAPGWLVTDFTFRMTAEQPLGWRASQGMAFLPCDPLQNTCADFNQGAISPVSENPFIGVLKCLMLDAAQQPGEGNVLIGKATLETYTASPPFLDVASYNAIGIEALAETNNGDGTLLLGGQTAEYNACPLAGSLSHFFDGAIEPLARASRTMTTLVLVPCTEDLSGSTPIQVNVDYLVVNEFEQQFGVTHPFTCFQAQTLSSISPIFSVGTAGTLAAQTRFRAAESGVLALAIQADQPQLGRPMTAAFNAYAVGVRAVPDVICLDQNCEIPTAPPTVTPVPTDTPLPTATNTPVSTATNTPMPTATDTSIPTATTLTATPASTTTRTETPTAVLTHGNAPTKACCQGKNGCNDKTEHACMASGGVFHPGAVCNKKNRRCEPP